ncbi:NAD(P)H-hydrate dehydratase [bacterium]|nr:NAD(P)H-hydrate dehydratase [bacterium]
MKPIYTANQMQEIDKIAIDEMGIPGENLMAQAGISCADFFMSRFPDKNSVIVILCGSGNNGGDGFVIARVLAENDYQNLTVYVTKSLDEIIGDAKFHLNLLEKTDVPILSENDVSDDDIQSDLNGADFIFDALLGTGLTRDVGGLYREWIAWTNASSAVKIAVDIPSGIDGNTGRKMGIAVESSHTITFGGFKVGLLLPPGNEFSGKVIVKEIGYPQEAIDAVDFVAQTIESDDVQKRFPQRKITDHKYTVGKVFVLAGSPGMTGAAVLSGNAALRTGAGLVVCGVPESLNPILEAKLTEVMTVGLPENERGRLSMDCLDLLENHADWCDVFACGPGLSKDSETAEMLGELLFDLDKPMVIDADGLRAFPKWKKIRKLKSKAVFTPHHGEFCQLLGIRTEELQNDIIGWSERFVDTTRAVLILKGAPTIVAAPEETVWINTTGNSGTATAGSGDVLTGMIASFIGQGLSSLDAAICAVYLHGLAGDFAAEEKGKLGMIANDLLENIPKTLKQFEL